MNKRIIIAAILTFGLVLRLSAQNIVLPYPGKAFSSFDNISEGKVTATIIYDNYVHSHELEADWGYSLLLEGLDKTILFDTGTNPEIFRSNFLKLNIEADKIDEVFISHEHGDHYGGLHELLSMSAKMSVVIPETFSSRFILDYADECERIEKISGPVQISNNLYSTGVLGVQIPEQALVLNTEKGLIVMTGCSHPGIISMLTEIKSTFGKNIYLVFGGFHLMEASDSKIESIIADMRELGVRKCGATHCTGERQIELFRKAFGKDFVEMGSGKRIILN